MQLLPALPRERTPWGARALALAIAVAGPLALTLGIGAPSLTVLRLESGSPERIVSIEPAVPAQAQAPDESQQVDGLPSTRAAGSVAPITGAVPRAGAGTVAMPQFPARDSSTAAPGPADAAAPRAAAPPSAREAFRSPLDARPMCLPPCGGSGTTVAGGDGTGSRAGLGVVFPPLTKERRDSIAQAVVAAAARVGGASGGARGSMPRGGVGVSIPVGLPGGGPTAAQRARDRALHADVSERLVRIRARADSLADHRRRDSVARATGRPARADSTRA